MELERPDALKNNSCTKTHTVILSNKINEYTYLLCLCFPSQMVMEGRGQLENEYLPHTLKKS